PRGAYTMTTIKQTLPILKGTLIARRNRFLADIQTDDGKLTVMCANTGSMKTCNEPGRPVVVSESPNENRKYRHTWEMIQMGKTWVNVNTGIPNGVVTQFID